MASQKNMFLLLLMLFAWILPAAAEERGSAEEAKALVDRGLAHVKAVGVEKAFADFTAGGKWMDRDLYIFAYDFKGTNLAYGGKPTMVGKDLSEIKDAEGRPLIKELIELAKSKGSGWHSYSWSDPLTKKALPKTSYIVRLPGTEVFIGAGAYKK